MRIYKYTLPIEEALSDIFRHRIPENAQFLTLQVQQEVPTLWYLVDPEKPMEMVTFQVVGTGHDFYNYTWYLGSFQLRDGSFVGHVFDITRSPE